MGSAIKSATKIQVGKETTRGTAVAAARRIVTPQATYRRQETFEQFEEDMDGLLTRSSRAPLNIRNGTELEIGGFPLDFEQILLPLLSGVKGGVTPTSPGTDAARLWTFKPSASADPAPDTFTVEFEESDFSSNAEMEAAYAFATELEITGGDEGAPEVRFIMTARRTSDATKTAGLSLPSLNPAANARWSVYVDDAWDGSGRYQDQPARYTGSPGSSASSCGPATTWTTAPTSTSASTSSAGAAWSFRWTSSTIRAARRSSRPRRRTRARGPRASFAWR